MKLRDFIVPTMTLESCIWLWIFWKKYNRNKYGCNDNVEATFDTGKESVNDQPTNIDDYIIVKFHHKNEEGSSSIVYLYKDKNSRYVE